MGKEIIRIAETLSNERDIPREKIFEALEMALATATKKKYKVEIAVRVEIDRKDGSYRTYRRWTVVDGKEPLENPSCEMTLEAARIEHPGIQPGEVIEDEIESVAFDRITIQTAKQVLSQRVKEAEREQIVAEQRSRIGHIINAAVKKQAHDYLILDLGNNAEAVLRREQLIPHETYGRGDRIKVLLQEIRTEAGKTPQIICSRTSPEFLRELFRIEVPEIGEDVIEIMGVARDPGSRSKVAVRSRDRRIDPRGACIGMRGSRVMAVSNELSGEKIDVVLWDENLGVYVTNAMEPAEISRIIINEDTHSIVAAVAPENLALAIGRNGQNVRLASQLIGWDLKVMTEQDVEQNDRQEQDGVTKLFTEALNVDEDFALALYDAGFSTLEQIAWVPLEEFSDIDGLEEDVAKQLQENAKAALDARKEQDRGRAVAELSAVKGIDAELAGRLADAEIMSVDDLFDYDAFDLAEKVGMPEKEAGEIIMAARNIVWSRNDESQGNDDSQGKGGQS